MFAVLQPHILLILVGSHMYGGRPVVGDQMALQTTTSVRPRVADRGGEIHCGGYLHSRQWVISQLGIWTTV